MPFHFLLLLDRFAATGKPISLMHPPMDLLV
jgi:hypothetical protein